MKRIFILLAGLSALVLIAAAANAESVEPCQDSGEHVCSFIDENADGFNDLAPDADGDGIPDGLDPDYVRAEEGTGFLYGPPANGGLFAKSFGEDTLGFMHRFGFFYGPRASEGEGAGPGSGAGFGPGSGTGEHGGNAEGNGMSGDLDGRHGRRHP